MIRSMCAILVVYLIFVVFLVVKQRSFIYIPVTNQRPDIKAAPMMEWVDVTTQDGLALRSWFSAPKEGQPTLLFFHGNAHHIESRLGKALPFIRAGYGVLLAEYRGYGGNPGTHSEAGFYHDARAQLNWLEQARGIPLNQIILYGESLGSGVAVQMASEHPEIRALILDVPFSSLADIVQSRFFFIPGVRYLLKDQYLNIDKIGRVQTPILIGLAGQDQVVPPRFGKKLYEAAHQPKTLHVYPKAGHMDIYAQGFAPDALAFINDLKTAED